MEIILQAFIRAFGWSIIHSLWQGAVIYGILLVILYLVPNLTPSRKHNLSYISQCALFIWFAATFFRVFQIPHNPSTSLLIFFEPGNNLIYAPGEKFSYLESLFPAITMLYLGGLLVQTILFINGYGILQKLKRSGSASIPESWTQAFYKTLAKIPVRRTIEFRVSPIASVPMVIGFFKPVILFPISYLNALDTEQVEAILIHEITHIKRNDYLLNLIKTCIETVLFFNPFIWLTGRIIRVEREHICDDMVLRFTGQPIKYAETLLQLELTKGASVPATAITALNKKQYLLNRIKRMTMKTKEANNKQKLTGVAIIFIAAFCLAWLAPIDTSKSPTQNEKAPIVNQPEILINNLVPIEKDTIPSGKKKQEIKIIVTDTNGKKQEYNSLESLPDSLKKSVETTGKPFLIFADSLKLQGNRISSFFKEVFRDTVNITSQKEFVRLYNSPEFKENLKRLYEFNTEEFKNKQNEFKQKLNSPEFKKQQEEIFKKLNSEEYKKQMAELMAKLQSKEFADAQKQVFTKIESLKWQTLPQIQVEGSDFSLSADSFFISPNNKDNLKIYLKKGQYTDDASLQKSKQYQKLKRKFERDVERLRKKQAAEAKK